ncbi:cell surface glycoprotein CD200 receptor 1 isoform X2 [Xenopus laevis]|uniref:Cell surface glycoprotein CD200 receptor 1 isoform X2 n=1 Tax=Xenopus laevis TaxID=8355 RepID=A0A8J1M8K2_XENLA|nr:cell surface glycoprotein CD200 receptor 1 isoform X2 [Xenopus laevis]
MSFLQTMSLVVCLVLFISVVTAVSVLRGETAILECEHKVPTRDSIIMITWKVRRLDNTHCYYSKAENKKFSNCSDRTEFNSTSLRIYNATVTDDGTYTCEIVTAEGTFINQISLQVLVEPSVTLLLNKLGVPECRAHGGNPAANMWWTAEAVGSISTNTAMQPDRSWTVTSTYTVTSNNVTQVTCLVSHPTFAQPQNHSISIPPNKGDKYLLLSMIPLAFLVILIIIGFLLFWTMSPRFRTCLSKEIKNTTVTQQDNNDQNKEDVEPYACYTQRINTIYNSVSEI